MKNLKSKIFDIIQNLIINFLIINPYVHKLNFLTCFVKKYTSKQNSKDSLVFLLKLYDRIYNLLGEESIRYGEGVHSKHHHTKYHDFFKANIEENKNILDVGCGYGPLAYSIASGFNSVNVYGVDISEKNIEKAKQKFFHKNIHYICEDVLNYLPDNKIDIIILSNVLEHLQNRVEFLKRLKEKYFPEKFLIRVPVFERDWTVPLKKELGINYFLDNTHFIEYTQKEFSQEMLDAGLKIESKIINWGEIWAVVKEI
jgi:2-polyprenyl-3-methyl-5-hydroxy-6-metoxy-1,4-benzoquinol methylase